ncbi:hypothetical protein LMG24076_04032 [Trinickia soli]|uniref:Uncharacterized protein n=1 Tax=Trinickia soli TaxID=380675 RepID=A0A2N7WC94_9BURK|nr:hypothetical protein C0Z19_04505 [Trinickia soli]CAB3711651.1 hypothetical protein LMG24076_04032 [Trinickia soli]
MPMQCGATGFFRVYKTNMEALGLDVPTSWYGTQVTILTKLGALVAAVDKFGQGRDSGRTDRRNDVA